MPLTRLPLGTAVSGNLDLANHVTGTLPAANYKAGSIIQVTDQVVISTIQTLSTDTYTDLTSATLTITPSSTSSKILLQAGINCKHDMYLVME